LTENINRLLDILSAETEVYRILVGIAEEKKGVIIENRVKELEKMTFKEQALASKLMKLERDRGEVIERIMGEEGISNVQTLSDLANRLDPMSREALNSSKGELLQSITSLKDKNKLNGELIEQSLRFIELSLDMMGSVEEDSRYGKGTSDRKVMQKKNIFDVKV
jgi:flagellar biosynthesis/type III secretory pathway chaperone